MAALRRLGCSATMRPLLPALCRSYKSDVSLDKLYPASNTAQTPPLEGGVQMKDVQIYDHDPANPYRVEIRVHLDSARWISQEARDRLRLTCKPFIDSRGNLVFASDKTRKKSINLADCLDKLRCMLRELSRPPPNNVPETRFTLRAKHERLAAARLRIPKVPAAESGVSS
ncbi:large ribosomal subunit protein mL62-like [Dermacentor albipictus]|uniref:large ribosomal subunit protein mL62-like n=1 Tax=Dermacentor albipictus TaxID=60249 RepID=UPI0038FD3017